MTHPHDYQSPKKPYEEYTIEERYAVLRAAVNEHYGDCLPGCDSYGHDCDAGEPAAMLMRAQMRIQELEALVRESGADAEDGQIAVNYDRYRALQRDASRIDAIERGDIWIESMGTTVPYQWVHGPGGDVLANRNDTRPKTLRQAMDLALVPKHPD